MSEQNSEKERESELTLAGSPVTGNRMGTERLSSSLASEGPFIRSDGPAQGCTMSLTERLAARGYWPARARVLITQGQYARAVEICRDHLESGPDVVSGRAIYATALHLAGQSEDAAEQFFQVLSRDPDNLVALKYLGDIKYEQGDEVTAMTYYHRVQSVDPRGHGLQCPVRTKPIEQTRTVTLVRPAENPALPGPIRTIPFYTETLADLYIAQGYPRLAAEIYRVLNERQNTPRLAGKLAQAEQSIRQKER